MLSLEAGARIADRYRIVARLGEGGFGVVFRAFDEKLTREVALKVLRGEALSRPAALGRFYREIELARRLSHPNTVRLYEVGQIEGGIPFIVWELLHGRSLEQLVVHEGALHPERVARIGVQVLKSLMEAHALGIVHRDIKPANIFLCEYAGASEFVKVLDFGIATLEVSDGRALTQEGMTVGTPQYMAPEQVVAGHVDARTDLYALGLVLAETLVARRVYDDTSSMRVCIAQASAEPAPLPEPVRRSLLGPVVQRATQKHPDARYPSAAAMLADLEAVGSGRTADVLPALDVPLAHAPTALGTLPTTSGLQPPPAVFTAPRQKPISRLGVLIAMAIVIVLGAGAFGFWWRSASPRLPRQQGVEARQAHPSLAAFEIRHRSAQQLLDRLAADGWSVTHEYHSVVPVVTSVNYVIVNGSVGGSLQFHSFNDLDTAKVAESNYLSQYGGVVREDKRVLLVAIGANHELARALVERLTE